MYRYFVLRVLDNVKQALLEDAYPERTWELVYDCGPHDAALTLGIDGTILEETRRVRVLMADRTEEELEAGIKALLLRAARRVRPEDVFHYFAQSDLAVGHNHGGMLDIDGEMIVVTDPEFVGVVGRARSGSGAAIYNQKGVVRVDPTAPPLERQPMLGYFRRIFTLEKPFTNAALRRAKALFFRYLSREQKWELRAHKRVTTIGQDGREYRIYAWQGGNVRLVEDGVETTTLCVVPNPAVTPKVPVHDLMLAHKLLLENAVGEFLSTARSWPAPQPPVEPQPVDVQLTREQLERIMVHFEQGGLVQHAHERRLQTVHEGRREANGEGRLDGDDQRPLQVPGAEW